jgi:hypothetical protein
VNPSRAQVRRLRAIYRSAGWPCQDTLELELLACGWLERLLELDGRERVRLTDAGVQAAALGVVNNRAARHAHEALVQRVAAHLQSAGRVVWTGLSLRAGLEREGAQAAAAPLLDDAPAVPLLRKWQLCEPDVFSLRVTSNANALEVAIHEIKVSRADLLTELRKPSKGAAYAALSGQTWFVLQAGIGQPEELPAHYGVWLAHPTHFELVRPAQQRAHQPDFATWLALARACPLPMPLDAPQDSF